MGWFSAMYVPWSRNARGAGWLAMYVCMYVRCWDFSSQAKWLGWVGGCWRLFVGVCWFGGFFWVCLGGLGEGEGLWGSLGGGFLGRWMEFVGCLFWLCCVVGVGLC